MDFEFTSEQIMIRDMVKEFVEKEVKPLAAKIDKTGVVEESLIAKARELGLFGICIPEKYGGANAGEMGYCITLEELSRGCGSFTAVIGGHLSLCVTAIMVDGNDEQKNEYLPAMARGERIGAFALTEPQAGSDAANIALSAELKGDKWILNGTKIWVTNGARSDIVIVFALTDKALRARGGITAFIVEKEFGVKVGKVEEKLGLKASDSAELIFEDVAVPKKNVLGEVGKGFLTAMKTLDVGRLTLGAGCVGGSKELLALSTEYAKTRVQFNEPIANKQAIQFYLANMAIQIYCMESIVYRTAWMADNGMKFGRESAIVKTFCTEAFNNIANMAMQIYGGYAYSKEYPVERFFRDARVMPIFEGTNEIQRIIIAQDIIRKGI